MSPKIENRKHLFQEGIVCPTWRKQHSTKHVANAIDTALTLITEIKHAQVRRKI